MNYRKAEIKDFLEISALDRNAWKENNNSEFIPDGEHAWRLWVEHALVYCATNDNEKIVGAILSFPSIDNIHCVHKVFVNRTYRGKGVGSTLFGELLGKIDDIGVDCFLTVDPTNYSAIKLYEKWGFGDRKFVKGYYRGNEDRFVMTRHSKKTHQDSPLHKVARHPRSSPLMVPQPG
ncbi:MAG: GNAT family N-acetyltransferase [Magnetococcales bacterium]|nr:GNAT family N-acetyltransferase [Magnetococcales bacterium]